MATDARSLDYFQNNFSVYWPQRDFGFLHSTTKHHFMNGPLVNWPQWGMGSPSIAIFLSTGLPTSTLLHLHGTCATPGFQRYLTATYQASRYPLYRYLAMKSLGYDVARLAGRVRGTQTHLCCYSLLWHRPLTTTAPHTANDAGTLILMNGRRLDWPLRNLGPPSCVLHLILNDHLVNWPHWGFGSPGIPGTGETSMQRTQRSRPPFFLARVFRESRVCSVLTDSCYPHDRQFTFAPP